MCVSVWDTHIHGSIFEQDKKLTKDDWVSISNNFVSHSIFIYVYSLLHKVKNIQDNSILWKIVYKLEENNCQQILMFCYLSRIANNFCSKEQF